MVGTTQARSWDFRDPTDYRGRGGDYAASKGLCVAQDSTIARLPKRSAMARMWLCAVVET